MNTPEVEFSRLTIKGQCTVPRRIRDFLGISPGDRVAFVRTGSFVLVKKLVVAETPMQGSREESPRELFLVVGREAQAQGLSEEDVEKDIDRHLENQNSGA